MPTITISSDTQRFLESRQCTCRAIFIANLGRFKGIVESAGKNDLIVKTEAIYETQQEAFDAAIDELRGIAAPAKAEDLAAENEKLRRQLEEMARKTTRKKKAPPTEIKKS